MKKLSLFAVLLLGVTALVACGDEASDTAESATTIVADTTSAIETEEPIEIEEEITASEPEPVQTAATEAQATVLANVFIHEDDYVIIEFIGVESSSRHGAELVFFIENKTDVELTFQSNNFALDGFDVGSTGGSDSIAAQSRGRVRFRERDEFPTSSPAMLTGGITVIDFSRTLLEHSYDVNFVNLEVGGEGTSDSHVFPTGVFVHEDEYVRIEFIGIDETSRGNELVFSVRNKTDVELTFQSNNFALDGFDVGSTGGSDSISAQSIGLIRFREREEFPTTTPSSLTGGITVIDFSRTLLERSYDVNFVNLEVE